MVPSARVVSFAAVLLALTVGVRESRAGDDAGSDPPDAARVVLRGKTELGDALRAAIRARGASPRRRSAGPDGGAGDAALAAAFPTR